MFTRFSAYATLNETDDTFVVKAYLPGLDEKALTLNVNEDFLTLAGSREVDAPKGYTVHRRERAPFQFSRTWEFPSKVNPDQVTATLEKGVLTVTLTKAADSKPRTIAIKAAA